jgi:hypothetical protein
MNQTTPRPEYATGGLVPRTPKGYAAMEVSCPHCAGLVEVDLTAQSRLLNSTAYTAMSAVVRLIDHAEFRMDHDKAVMHVIHRHVPGVRDRHDPRKPKFSFTTILYTLLEPHGA